MTSGTKAIVPTDAPTKAPMVYLGRPLVMSDGQISVAALNGSESVMSVHNDACNNFGRKKVSGEILE